MTKTHVLTLDALLIRVQNILEKSGMSRKAAGSVARVIVAGERDRCKSHGIYRLEGCLRVLRAGKVSPDAIPELKEDGGPLIEVQAKGGFSSPAYDVAKPRFLAKARELGLAAMIIRDCVHFSALWYEVEDLAGEGLAALSFCPSYAVVAPAGGNKPLLGTNPFAFGWPRPGKYPYVFDFATSAVARGEIELHRQANKPIPEGWALDAAGAPTTDPAAALAGTMLPFGGHKGSAIATMIELLAGAMLGEFMSREALEFMGGATLLPRHGALILGFDPGKFASGSGRDPRAEGEKLLTAFRAQGARLPSQRRFLSRERSQREGVTLTQTELDLLDRLEAQGLKAVTA